MLGKLIDKLTAIMSKLTTQTDKQVRPSKPNIYQRKGGINAGLIIMIDVGIKAD